MCIFFTTNNRGHLNLRILEIIYIQSKQSSPWKQKEIAIWSKCNLSLIYTAHSLVEFFLSFYSCAVFTCFCPRFACVNNKLAPFFLYIFLIHYIMVNNFFLIFALSLPGLIQFIYFLYILLKCSFLKL